MTLFSLLLFLFLFFSSFIAFLVFFRNAWETRQAERAGAHPAGVSTASPATPPRPQHDAP